MTTRPPAEIGMTLDEVDTPALIVDLDAFERNLRRLPERITGTGVRARPHAKTHKCPVIALKQVALGAVGVCVQKVSEAEAMVQGGVPDVLVTNEIVGRQKLRRLAALAHVASIGVCADDPSQIRALDEAAGEAGVTLPVYVEVNMGGNRCGIEPGEPALALARQITQAPHLSFGGLQAYHGSAQHLRGWEERRQAITGAADKAGRTRDLLARHGIECPAVTGAGTGTFEFEIFERRLHRIAMRLVHLHGRRLRPQPRPRRRPDQGVRAEPFRVGDGDEPPDRGPRDRRRRLEGARLQLGPAARLRRTRRHLRARLRRARPPRHLGRHQPPRPRRQDPPRPGPLRPDSKSLRLVCLHSQQPRRAALAHHRTRRSVLTLAGRSSQSRSARLAPLAIPTPNLRPRKSLSKIEGTFVRIVAQTRSDPLPTRAVGQNLTPNPTVRQARVSVRARRNARIARAPEGLTAIAARRNRVSLGCDRRR